MFSNRKLRWIAIAYILLQVVIWVKCIAFFAWFGYGMSGTFNVTAFPEWALAFDFFFHSGMHFAIGILALLFGKSIGRVEWPKLVAVVFAAVAVHNVAYWFTASHQYAWYSALDFTRDSLILFAFVVAGHVFGKLWTKALKAKQKD